MDVDAPGPQCRELRDAGGGARSDFGDGLGRRDLEPDAHRDLGVGALRDRPQGERRRERRGEDRADADRARHAQLGGEGLEREGRADERQGAAQGIRSDVERSEAPLRPSEGAEPHLGRPHADPRRTRPAGSVRRNGARLGGSFPRVDRRCGSDARHGGNGPREGDDRLAHRRRGARALGRARLRRACRRWSC